MVQFLVPDLILSTILKEDDNNDLTLEETWATSDYWFQSNNSAPHTALGRSLHCTEGSR